jgi:translation initiation factor IF-2
MRNYGSMVADAAVLVVAADEGVCPQTKECIGILEALRLPVLVCVNKVDHADVSARPELLQQLTRDLGEYVALEAAQVVQVSAKTGVNMQALREGLVRLLRDQVGVCLDPAVVLSRCLQELAAGNNPGAAAASGTILNCWRDRDNGTVLHLVLRTGVVRPQQTFSAGGW